MIEKLKYEVMTCINYELQATLNRKDKDGYEAIHFEKALVSKGYEGLTDGYKIVFKLKENRL